MVKSRPRRRTGRLLVAAILWTPALGLWPSAFGDPADNTADLPERMERLESGAIARFEAIPVRQHAAPVAYGCGTVGSGTTRTEDYFRQRDVEAVLSSIRSELIGQLTAPDLATVRDAVERNLQKVQVRYTQYGNNLGTPVEEARVAVFASVQQARLVKRKAQEGTLATEILVASDPPGHRFLLTHDKNLRPPVSGLTDRTVNVLAGYYRLIVYGGGERPSCECQLDLWDQLVTSTRCRIATNPLPPSECHTE